MEEYRFIVSDEYEGERIDKYLSILMPDCSRSFLQKIIKDKNVLLNKAEAKSSAKIIAGDEVILNLPEPVIPSIEPQNIPIDIVYEDKDIIIINKPKDMVVHPAPGHYKDTIVNAIMYHCDSLSGINGVLRPGIVHRIDKNTTGLIVVCKNDSAHNHIADLLKDHNIERTYYALCKNNIKEDTGIINKNIGRDPKDRKKMAICSCGGKTAITHFTVLERFGNYTLIKCNLETGRTHQIRVHMSSIGHPIVGDEIYGGECKEFKTNGQMLHAKTLGFIHPSTKEFVQFDSDLPEYFENILCTLRAKMQQ